MKATVYTFILIFILSNTILATAARKTGSVVQESSHTKQTSKGRCSPNLNNVIGDVTINCPGISKDTEKLLTAYLNETIRKLKREKHKNITLAEKLNEAKRIIKGYEKLKERIAKEPSKEEIDKQIDQHIVNAEFKDAKHLLLAKIKKKNREQAKDHYKLAGLYKLGLDYSSALRSYQEAVRLAPKNSLYLNDLGVLLGVRSEEHTSELQSH